MAAALRMLATQAGAWDHTSLHAHAGAAQGLRRGVGVSYVCVRFRQPTPSIPVGAHTLARAEFLSLSLSLSLGCICGSVVKSLL